MTTGAAGGGDFEALARQYWSAWGDALRQGGPAGAPGPDVARDGWQQAVQWWTQLLPTDATPQAQDTVERFRRQAGDWFGTMQQVAARFAGRDTSAAEVADAWRQAVSGQGEQLMQWTLGALRGGGHDAFDPWVQEAAQALEKWRQDNASWLELPAFGLGRNHQARWQTLARVQQDYQAQSQAYADQLRTAIERAFGLFEAKLAEHETSGSQLTSARALFDLWIEAAEEAYAAIALSEEFRQVYGGFANAHMRLRAALQQEVEQLSERFGMPTRSEMDAAHRRIAELERTLRRLAAAVAAQAAAAGAAPADAAASLRPRPAKRAAPDAGAKRGGARGKGQGGGAAP